MSTVGLELLNFVNPDLTWKTVAKGYRSNSRRKPACRNFTFGKVIPDKGDKKIDDTTISDTEKNGVDVLGRHFSGKVELVPIKKRRFKVGSLSPPKQSHRSRYKLTDPSFLFKRQHRAKDMLTASKFNRNKKIVKEDTFGCDEDFSGIEILATVACNNGMANDTGFASCSLATESTKEGTHLFTTAIVSKEVVDTPKDVATSEDRIQVSSLSYEEDTLTQRSPSVMHEVQLKVASSSRVVLDLNQIPMDACESPCSMPCEDPLADNVQIDNKPSTDKPLEDFGIQGEAIDIKQNLCEEMKNLPEYPRVNQKGVNHEASSSVGVNHGEHDLSLVDETQKCSVDEVDIVRASNRLNGAACMEIPEHSGMMDSSTLNLTQSVEVSMPKFQPSETVETSHGASQSTLDTEKVVCENDCTTSKRDEEITCQPETFGTLEAERVQLAKHVVHLQPSSSHGATITSNPAISEGEPVVPATLQGQANAASLVNAAEVDSPAHDGSEELMQKSSVDSTATHSGACGAWCCGRSGSLVKTIAEDPTEDNDVSDVRQADKLRVVIGEDMNGYDSQFEDGELREQDARYFWDENEDYVDYGSEDDEERLCGMGNGKEKKSRSVLTEDPDNVSQANHLQGKDGSQRYDSASPRTRNSDVTADKEFASGIGRIRATNKESQSCTGKPDSVRGQDPGFRSRAENGSTCQRDEREASSRRLIETETVAFIRGRSPVGRRFVSPSVGYWDSKRRFSPPRGTYISGPPRPKNVPETRGYMTPLDHMDSEGSNGAGFDARARRNFVKTSSNAQYERFARRAPGGRDESYGMHRPTLNARGISPGRNNFRRYSNGGIGRGLRNEYQRSIPGDDVDYRHRFAGRERSISPSSRGRRVPCNFQYKKSRSRSGSRSPTRYLLPRDRNNSQRFDSRSPVFSQNGRMGRGRVPFQKRLPEEYDEGFLSPPRGRFSPQRDPRCFDDRNDTNIGRKLPVRTFRQNQRFDSGNSFQRLNSEVPYRLPMHSRKFNDGRRGEYEGGGDDDRRKGRDRFDMVQRVRRYDTDGVVRRFRYNPEDSFTDNNSRNFNDTKLPDWRLGEVATDRAGEGE